MFVAALPGHLPGAATPEDVQT